MNLFSCCLLRSWKLHVRAAICVVLLQGVPVSAGTEVRDHTATTSYLVRFDEGEAPLSGTRALGNHIDERCLVEGASIPFGVEFLFETRSEINDRSIPLGGGGMVSDGRVKPVYGIYRVEVESESADGGGVRELLESIPGVIEVWEERIYTIGGRDAHARGDVDAGGAGTMRSVDRRTRMGADAHDPFWQEQWGLRRIGIEDAWLRTRGTGGVVIAIIDTGCDRMHPDLGEKLWTNEAETGGSPGVDDDGNGYIDDSFGWDFVSVGAGAVADGEDPGPPDGDPDDFNGHGTHVAGIAAAEAGNGLGIEGAAPNCRIMILRAGYETPYGAGELREGDVAAAICYAANNGADVINMSFGGPGSALVHEAIRSATGAGVIAAAAAGNGGSEIECFPAAFEEVLGVAAVDEFDRPAAFSGHGDWISCAAPGVSIISTIPEGYGRKSGTSAAVPFVSACAALVRSLHPGWGPAEVAAQILNTCERINPDRPVLAAWTGEGLCRIDQALSAEPSLMIMPVAFEVHDPLGDGDGVAEAGERVTLVVEARNAWAPAGELCISLLSDDAFVSIHDGGPKQVGPLSTGEIVVLEFSIECSSQLPHFHETSFALEVAYGGDIHHVPFSLTLFRRPCLSIRRVVIEETDGDGDGGADPGEEILLGVEIENEGVIAQGTSVRFCTTVRDVRIGPDSVDLGDMGEGERGWAVFNLSVGPGVRTGNCIELPLVLESADYSVTAPVPLWVSYSGDPGAAEPPAMLQGDAGHSGCFPCAPRLPLSALWAVELPGEGSLRCQPVARQGCVFIVREESGRRVVYSLDASNGRIMWSRRLTGRADQGPASLSWYRGTCYIGGGECLQALEAATGRLVWNYPAEPRGEEPHHRVGDPAVCRGSVFFTLHDTDHGGGEHLCAVDPYTGRLLWKSRIEHGCPLTHDAPACGVGYVFVADVSGVLRAFDAGSGGLQWARDTGAPPAAPVMVSGSHVMAASVDGRVMAFDAYTGEAERDFRVQGSPASPLCCEDGTIYILYKGGTGFELAAAGIGSGECRRIDGCGSGETAGFVLSEGRMYISSGRSLAVVSCGGEGIACDAHEIEVAGEGYGPLAGSSPFIANGRIYLSLNGNGIDIVASLGEGETAPPNGRPFLGPNRPNPFNPVTRITFHLPERELIRIAVYDVAGRLVKVLADGRRAPGPHELYWNGTNGSGRPVATGVYFAVLSTGNLVQSRKMILIR